MTTGKTQTSRQRVLRTLEFDTPDRVARNLWLAPGLAIENGRDAVRAFRKRWPDDFTQVSAGKPQALRAQGDPYQPGTSTDEWGCVFHNLQAGVHGEVKEPLLDDWSKLDDVVRPPEELLDIDVEAANAFCRQEDHFVFASGWARLFERMQFLRGSENLYMDLALQPDRVRELRDRVHAFNVKLFEAWSRTDADGQVIMDDWGSQRGLLISPGTWRELFKPCYAEYCAIARDAGKKVFMHSDGHIMTIYEDLIEIGVDAINSQLFCMDIEEIGRRFAGRITFWGEIDRQHVLAFGRPDDARDAVQRVVDALYRPEGGVIAQCELGAGSKIENGHAVYAAWDELTARPA